MNDIEIQKAQQFMDSFVVDEAILEKIVPYTSIFNVLINNVIAAGLVGDVEKCGSICEDIVKVAHQLGYMAGVEEQK